LKKGRLFHAGIPLRCYAVIFIPLGNIIIPLILWITKRDKIIGLNEQGADLLNFQILWTLLFSGLIVTGIIHYLDNTMVSAPSDSDFSPPEFIIGSVLFILNIIYPIVVSILTGRGSLKRYYYPLIRFVRL
jgi:uncharacterized Tic20 family protein